MAIIIWGLCAWLGATIGKSKGRGSQGFWLGLLLGPFGVIAIALLPPVRA